MKRKKLDRITSSIEGQGLNLKSQEGIRNTGCCLIGTVTVDKLTNAKP